MSQDSMRVVLVTVFLLVSGFVLVSMFIPGSMVQLRLLEVFEWVQSMPTFLGVIVMACSYTLAVTFMLPGTPFNFGASYMFGFALGAPIAVFGAFFGASGAFLMGRFLVRDWAEEKMHSDRRFRALDRAIKKNGVNLVFLMRLSPIMPFPLLSYIFGVTQIRWQDYCLGTFFGLLPATVIEAYLGQEIKGLGEALNHEHSSSLYWIAFVVIATLVSLGFVSYISHQALSSAMAEESPPPSPTLGGHLPSHLKRPVLTINGSAP